MGAFIFLKMIKPIRKNKALKAIGNNLSSLFEASRSDIKPLFFRYRTVIIGSIVLKKKDNKNIRLGLTIVNAV